MSLDINFDAAEVAYLAANTPMYLVKRMVADTDIQSLARTESAESLLHAYRSAAVADPEELKDLVKPFVFLAALSIAGRVQMLREATLVTPKSHYKFLPEFLRLLLETARVSGNYVFSTTPQGVSTGPLRSSSGTTSTTVILP